LFKFDSSWEDALAKRLDELDIEWDRPPPVLYQHQGKAKRYFPDFYLPRYNLHVDPKNAYCLRQQREKLEIVKTLITLAILPSLKDCKAFDPNSAQDYVLK
jgi:hypothetical protein